MGLRNMLILLAIGFLIVLALGAYVVFVESTTPTTDEAAKKSGLVFQIKDERNRTIRDLATKLEIQRGKETVVLEKTGAQEWRMRKPADARADRSAILALLDTLGELKTKLDPIPLTDENLASLGLKEPRIVATFWLGDASHQLAIGAEEKGEKSYEKRVRIRLRDEPSCLIVANDVAEKLDKEPSAFRDKKVFDRARDPEKATALRVASAARTLELERGEKAWSLRSPVTDVADTSKVTSLLSKARNLDVEKFISEDASKPAEWGLDKPQLTAEVKAEDGTMMKLLVGKEATEKDHLYAKRAEEPSVFTIKKDFLTDMEVKLEDIRDKRVASFEDGDVTGIELTAGKATWAIERENKDKDWKLTKPREAKAYQSGASDILRNAGKLRVTRWIDDPKDPAHDLLKTPEAVLTLLREPKGKPGAKAQPPVKLYLSAIVKKEKEKPKEPPKDDKEKKPEDKPKEKEFEEGRYVRREGQTTLLYVLGGKAPDSAAYDEKDSVEAVNGLGESFTKGYLALLDRRVFDFNEDDVTRLTIERDSAKLVCEKKDGNWKLTSPAALDADKGNVSKITNTMNDLSADDYVAEAPKPDDLKRYGLDAAALRITASVEEEEKKEEPKAEPKPDEKKKEEAKPPKKTYTKTLLVSRKIDGKTYAMEQGGTLLFTLRSYDADDLRTEVISTTIGEFTEGDATSLTIAHRGRPELVVEKEKDKDTWAITKPKKAEADQDAVKKVIDALQDLKARRCLDYEAKKLADYGLDPAEVTVTVKIKDKSDLVLKLGKPVEGEKDDPGSAAVKGDAKQVFLLAKGKVEDISKSLSDLEKKPEPKKEEPKEEEPKKEAPKSPEPKAPEKKEPEKKPGEK